MITANLCFAAWRTIHSQSLWAYLVSLLTSFITTRLNNSAYYSVHIEKIWLIVYSLMDVTPTNHEKHHGAYEKGGCIKYKGQTQATK